MQDTQKSAADEIREEMAQMRTNLGLVLKHVTGGVGKVNVVNYLAKPPPLVDEYYYEEDSYAANDQTGGFWPNAQGSNQENWCQGQGNQGRNYGNYNREGHYVQAENHNRENNFNHGNYGKRNECSTTKS